MKTLIYTKYYNFYSTRLKLRGLVLNYISYIIHFSFLPALICKMALQLSLIGVNKFYLIWKQTQKPNTWVFEPSLSHSPNPHISLSLPFLSPLPPPPPLPAMNFHVAIAQVRMSSLAPFLLGCLRLPKSLPFLPLPPHFNCPKFF